MAISVQEKIYSTKHPVVQEVIRLFDAHIVAIAQAGANEGDGRPAVEQQVLCCSSQEA